MIKKCTLVFFGLMSSSGLLFAQKNYLTKEFKGVYPKNILVETLGDILVSGYLKGEIQAYAFAYRDTVLKSKRIVYPPHIQEWNNFTRYIINTDTVLYNGKYYEADYPDLTTQGMPPSVNSNEWQELPAS